MITDDDITMVQYFHCEKGDHTRYHRWEEIKNEFNAKFPEFAEAMWQKNRAVKHLNEVVRNLPTSDED